MSDFIDVEVPVRGMMVSDAHLAAVQPVRMRTVASNEAPTVIRWKADWREQEYRALDGRLMEPLAVVGRLNEVRAEELVAPQGGWGSVEIATDAGRALLEYPFPAVVANGRNRTSLPTFVDDVSEHPHLSALMERTRVEMEACVVIDGVVWMPSRGPVCRIDRYAAKGGDLARFRVGANVVQTGRMPDCLSVLELEPFVDRARATFKKVETTFRMPEVLSTEGWSLDDVLTQQDETIMANAKATARRTAFGLDKGLVSTAAMEALLALRELKEDAPASEQMPVVAEAMGALVALADRLHVEQGFIVRKWALAVDVVMSRNEPAPDLSGFSA